MIRMAKYLLVSRLFDALLGGVLRDSFYRRLVTSTLPFVRDPQSLPLLVGNVRVLSFCKKKKTSLTVNRSFSIQCILHRRSSCIRMLANKVNANGIQRRLIMLLRIQQRQRDRPACPPGRPEPYLPSWEEEVVGKEPQQQQRRRQLVAVQSWRRGLVPLWVP